MLKMPIFYIDPGTGSMLFTILLGLMSAGVYALRNSLVKLRFYLSGGKAEKHDEDAPDYVIFSDHKRYWNIFEPICDEFERRGIDLMYMTASPDDPAITKGYEHIKAEFIGEGNKAYARLNTMNADILLSTTPSLDVFYWKRSKKVKWYVHIPHAASDLTIYRMFGIDYYDAILTPGDFHVEQVRALERVRELPEKEIVKVGIPYMDEMANRLKRDAAVSTKGTTVLLAPSWGPSGIFSKYGGELIDKLLETDYHIVIRPHPQSYTSEKDMIEDLMSKYPASDRLEWNRDNDNFDILKRSDILISDFSGVIFDFTLVFDKPVIYTDVQFDTSPYDACWLDEELWTMKVLPEIGAKLTAENMDTIGSLIDNCLNDSRFKEGRDKARNEAWAYRGEGTTRTVDYLIEKHSELMKEVEKKESK